MKVCYDHQVFSWQKYGGISRYFCEIARSLQLRRLCDVQVVAPLYVNEYLKQLTGNVSVSGMYVNKLPKVSELIRRINGLVAKPLIKAIKPDILHETYYGDSVFAPDGAKTVITIHDMIQEKFQNMCRGAGRAIKQKRLAIDRADHIICVSENTRQDLIKICDVDPRKTSVVYHGFSLLAGTGAMPKVMAGKPYFLYVGDRAGYKNFATVVKVFSRSSFLKKECNLLCFGGGAFSKSEMRSFSECGLKPEQVVQISGDDSLLSAAYKNAVALVYPSLYEGFGIPPLEAMSLNCPVICANTSSIPEVVRDSGLYFDPSDIEELSLQMERYVLDASLRSEMIAKGLTRSTLFSWDKCALETMAVYQEVLSG